RCRWQTDDLMIDDQRSIFICAGNWRGQSREGQILQQAVGHNRQALFSQFGSDRTEQDLAYLGSLGFELLWSAGYGQQVEDTLDRGFYLLAFWQHEAGHRSSCHQPEKTPFFTERILQESGVGIEQLLNLLEREH